jgi:hypothetical protein
MSTAVIVLLIGTAAVALVLLVRRRAVASDGETANRAFRDSVWTSSGGVYEPMLFDGGGGHGSGHAPGGSDCVDVEAGSSGDSGSCGGDAGGGDGGGGGGGAD